MGERFGKLTVTGLCFYTSRSRQIECKCDCGNVCLPTVARLRQGKATSCGCDKRPRIPTPQVGDTFGRLTVIETPADLLNDNGQLYTIHGHRAVMARCSCGAEIDVEVSNLVNGKTKSCGCLKAENAKKNLHPAEPGPNHPAWQDYSGYEGMHIGCRSRLTYIKEVDAGTNARGDTLRMGLFKCDCGNEVTRPLSATIYARIRSCGKCSDTPYKSRSTSEDNDDNN